MQMRSTAKRNGSATDRNAVVLAFLKSALADGAVAVADLEVRARAAGLLGERQMITDAKVFKRAKKMLGVRSIRDGFGRGGEWVWALPTQTIATVAEPVEGQTATLPATVADEDHSRPEQWQTAEHRTRSRPEGAPIRSAPSHHVPAEWVRGVASLTQQQRPASVPQHRWELLHNDCMRFLDPRLGWAERAAELGWDTVALFGCHPARPLDHLGAAGLVWLVAGGRLVQLQKDWAMITATGGAQRVFHRRPRATNLTLPWRPRQESAQRAKPRHPPSHPSETINA